MKKITLLFFTFLGIYTGFAQKPAVTSDSINAKQHPIENIRPGQKDSLIIMERPSIRLYPNPAKNKVEIEIKGFDPGYVQVQLIDINGKRVRDEKRLVIRNNDIIVFMFSEKPGLYFLLLKQGEKKLRSKLIIQ